MKMKLVTDPKKAAKIAHLVYVTDDIPGYSRIAKGKDFVFVDEDGQVIKDKTILERMHKLAIPPAYTNVWICPLPDGHLQFTAKDARGRKQYRYHEQWRSFRSLINHERMIEFGQVLPAIREHIENDLHHTKLDKTKVLATVVKIMDLTLIRVGNQEYAKENDSYGLTTMQDRHVDIAGSQIHFAFKGKSHQKHVVDIKNKQLSKIVKRCMDVPGYDLFQYYAVDGQHHPVRSQDINDYLKSITGLECSAKDFRTWWATVLTMMILQDYPIALTKRESQLNVVKAIKEVAKKLGNTPAVCKKNYIYNGLLDAYVQNKLPEFLKHTHYDEQKLISREEQATLHFLKEYLK